MYKQLRSLRFLLLKPATRERNTLLPISIIQLTDRRPRRRRPSEETGHYQESDISLRQPNRMGNKHTISAYYSHHVPCLKVGVYTTH